jgi:hypothetical protein
MRQAFFDMKWNLTGGLLRRDQDAVLDLPKSKLFLCGPKRAAFNIIVIKLSAQ